MGEAPVVGVDISGGAVSSMRDGEGRARLAAYGIVGAALAAGIASGMTGRASGMLAVVSALVAALAYAGMRSRKATRTCRVGLLPQPDGRFYAVSEDGGEVVLEEDGDGDCLYPPVRRSRIRVEGTDASLVDVRACPGLPSYTATVTGGACTSLVIELPPRDAMELSILLPALSAGVPVRDAFAAIGR